MFPWTMLSIEDIIYLVHFAPFKKTDNQYGGLFHYSALGIYKPLMDVIEDPGPLFT